MDIPSLTSVPVLQQVLPAAAVASVLAIAQPAPVPAVADAAFQVEMADLVANAQAHEAERSAVAAGKALTEKPATDAPGVQTGAVTAAVQPTPATDLLADDLRAQASMVLLAQQTALAASRAGSGDVSVLLSGLPAGAISTLLGGGWVWVAPGADRIAASWSLDHPNPDLDIPAVTGPARTEPIRGGGGHPASTGTPLLFYGSHGEQRSPAGLSFATTLDFLE